MAKELVGKITHYYDKIQVGVLELSGALKVGDKISVEKGEESFEQTVDSMQIENDPIQKAKAGQAIGIKLAQQTKAGAQVFKVTE